MTVQELMKRLSAMPMLAKVGVDFEGATGHSYFAEIEDVVIVGVDCDSFSYVAYEGVECGDVLCVRLNEGNIIRAEVAKQQ